MNVKECEKVFISSTSLKVPLRTRIEEKHYEYKECGKTFTYSSKITSEKTAEVSSIHVRNAQFPSSFSNHMSTNIGERPYDCKQCDKSFYSSYFTVHVITQIGEKHCGYMKCRNAFGCSSSLRKLVRTHTEKKSY